MVLLFLHVRSVVVTSTGVAGAENAGDGDSGAELLGEGGAGSLGADASVAVLAEQDVAGAGIAGAPDRPALGVDDASHGGLLVDDLSVRTPWTAEVEGAIGNSGTGGSGNGAAVEDVFGLGRGAGGAVGCEMLANFHQYHELVTKSYQ